MDLSKTQVIEKERRTNGDNRGGSLVPPIMLQRVDGAENVAATLDSGSDCRDQLIFCSKRLDDPSSAVAGIDLLTSIDQPEGFEEGHIPLDCFPVPPECRREF